MSVGRKDARELIDEAAGMTFGEPRRAALRAALTELEAAASASGDAPDEDIEARAVALAMLAQQDSAALGAAIRAFDRAAARGVELNWVHAHLAEACSLTGDHAGGLLHASAVRRGFFDERDLHWRSVRMDEVEAASLLALGRFDEGVELASHVAAELALRGDIDDLAAPTTLTSTALSLVTDGNSAPALAAGCRVLAVVSQSIQLSEWFAPDYAAEVEAARASCGDHASS